MDGLIAYALAKKYTDKVGQDIISAGFKVQVEDNRSILNRQGEEKVLYLLPKEYGSSQDGYDEFVYANNNWEWVGKTDVSLDYTTLENKPKFKIQSTNGTTQDITIENDIKLFPFYKDVFTGFIRIDEDKYCKTLLSGIKSIGSFDDRLYPNIDQNGVHLYSVNPNGIPHFINAKDNIFIVYHFTSEYNHASQIILWVDETTVKPKMAYRVCDYNHDTQQYNIKDFIEIGGGSQIVSGVVNANGTITFTDSEGNSFTTSGESVIGPPGDDYVLTAQDKTDIANIVLSELPTTEEVLYGNQNN